MANPSEKKRLLLTIGVSAVLVGVLTWLILEDHGEIEAVEGEIETLEERIRAADVEIKRTTEREDKVVVFRAVEKKELEILPSKQKIAEFYSGLSKFFQAAGLRFRELPESKPVESDLAKGIFVTRSRVEGQGDAAAILKFINMLENDPRLVSVRGLKIDAARNQPDDPQAPILHDVVVDLESYYYAPTGDGAAQVTIQGEEQRLQSAPVKAAIAAFVPERPATYDLRLASSRRDPLVDPRERRAKASEAAAAADLARQEGIVSDAEAALADLQEVEERGRALLASGELFKGDRVFAELELGVTELRARLAQVLQMKSVTNAALLGRVQAVQQRVEELTGRRAPRQTAVTRALAEKTLADMKRMFDAGAFGDVASTAQGWTEYLRGKQVAPDATAAIEAIGVLRGRARILAETEAIAVQVTGTLVNDSQPARSVAVVNGKHRKPGEAIDEGGEVLVHAVYRDRVEFSYKGEVFSRPRTSGSGAPAGTGGRTPPGGRR